MSDKVPDGWKKYKLGDIVRLNPYSIDSNFKYSQIVYLDTGSIKEGKITELKEYKLTDAPSSAKRLVKNNNIIYSTVRPIQRHYGIIKNPPDNMVVSNGFVVLEAIEEIIDPYFLYYFLTLDKIIDTLEAIAEASSSVYPTFRIPVLENLTIFLPSLPEQRAIASVLSSIDDKIDLLQRENKTLEAMAETLFRQWFIEEAEDDWQRVPLSFLGNIVCGKTPPKQKKEYFGGNIPFIKIPDMQGNIFIFQTSDTLTEEGKQLQNNKTLPPKSICVSCIATVGLVSMNAKESQTNQQINSIIPKKDFYRYYLYLFMKNSVDLLKAMASGGTITLNLNTSDFSKIKVILPDENKLTKFHEIVEPMFDRIYINYVQIRTLTQLRDTLLPKLMSGEVRVDLCQS